MRGRLQKTLIEQPGYKIPIEYSVMRLKIDLLNELASTKVKKVLVDQAREHGIAEADIKECKPEIKIQTEYWRLMFGGSPFKQFEVEFVKPDGTVAMTRTKFSIKSVMEVLSPKLRRIFGLFFDTTAKYTLMGLLDGVAHKFKHALFLIPRLMIRAVKLIFLCTPPFPIIHKIHME